VNLLHIVGARPNFMKVAPVLTALKQRPHVEQTLVHTGQHYDVSMSDVFFQQLGIPSPDVNLAVGSGSHAKQTAEIMIRLEPVLQERQPDMVLVYGDVNSTVATALVCAKLGVQLGHVEAGLRSFDRTMPEEINRLVTDQLADLLFTPSEDGDENLRREGIPPKNLPRRQRHDRLARAPFAGRGAARKDRWAALSRSAMPWSRSTVPPTSMIA
jgi:UDP-N-acetylglucosamine 2-epimerase (non-hydrolysing)